eukprot:Clim_evm10s232 gene=Clim_evmTU10s232
MNLSSNEARSAVGGVLSNSMKGSSQGSDSAEDQPQNSKGQSGFSVADSEEKRSLTPTSSANRIVSATGITSGDPMSSVDSLLKTEKVREAEQPSQVGGSTEDKHLAPLKDSKVKSGPTSLSAVDLSEDLDDHFAAMDEKADNEPYEGIVRVGEEDHGEAAEDLNRSGHTLGSTPRTPAAQTWFKGNAGRDDEDLQAAEEDEDNIYSDDFEEDDEFAEDVDNGSEGAVIFVNEGRVVTPRETEDLRDMGQKAKSANLFAPEESEDEYIYQNRGAREGYANDFEIEESDDIEFVDEEEVIVEDSPLTDEAEGEGNEGEEDVCEDTENDNEGDMYNYEPEEAAESVSLIQSQHLKASPAMSGSSMLQTPRLEETDTSVTGQEVVAIDSSSASVTIGDLTSRRLELAHQREESQRLIERVQRKVDENIAANFSPEIDPRARDRPLPERPSAPIRTDLLPEDEVQEFLKRSQTSFASGRYGTSLNASGASLGSALQYPVATTRSRGAFADERGSEREGNMEAPSISHTGISPQRGGNDIAPAGIIIEAAKLAAEAAAKSAVEAVLAVQRPSLADLQRSSASGPIVMAEKGTAMSPTASEVAAAGRNSPGVESVSLIVAEANTKAVMAEEAAAPIAEPSSISATTEDLSDDGSLLPPRTHKTKTIADDDDIDDDEDLVGGAKTGRPMTNDQTVHAVQTAAESAMKAAEAILRACEDMRHTITATVTAESHARTMPEPLSIARASDALTPGELRTLEDRMAPHELFLKDMERQQLHAIENMHTAHADIAESRRRMFRDVTNVPGRYSGPSHPSKGDLSLDGDFSNLRTGPPFQTTLRDTLAYIDAEMASRRHRRQQRRLARETAKGNAT